MFGIRDAEMMREVARSGGFRAAAQALELSQSAVSNRIATLERKLGVLLFDRSKRQVRLTAEGRRFLEEIERLVALRDQIAESFAGKDHSRATLRLGVAETVVHTRMAAIVKALQDAAPGLRIELAVDTSARLAEKLVADELDVAALMKQFMPPSAVGVSVGRFELDWYAAPTLGLSGRMGVADIAAHPIVTFSKETLPFREVERLFARPDIPVPLLHGSASLATVMNLVADGVGIGTLPRAIARDAVAAGRIGALDVEDEAVLSPLQFTLCRVRDLGEAVETAMGALD
ncbi:MAG: LysR family transcriptional regulator [Pseudomonadota bacterium]